MNQSELRRMIEESPDAKLRDLVAELLYNEIVGLKLPLGSKLNVNQLASSLGVSRTPVAEAITCLEEKGFILTKPGMSGFFIIDLSLSDMLSLYRVRSALEGEAAALCARSADDKVIAQLKDMAAEFKDSIIRNDVAAMKQVDLPFHDLIIRSCNNSYILQSYEVILPKIAMYQASTLECVSRQISKDDPWVSSLAFNHTAIASAISMRLPELARQSTMDHIDTSINLATISGLNDSLHKKN